MAHYHQEWEDLGRNIQSIVDQAVNSQDYQKLNQTIRQVVGRAVDVGSEAVRKAVDNASRTAPGTSQAAYRETSRPAAAEQKKLPVLYGNPNRKTAVGILKIVGGSLLCGFSMVGTLAALAMDFMFGIPGGGLGGWPAIACIAGGGLLIGSGVRNVSWANRFKIYRKALGQKTHITLEKLARSVGKTVKFVRRELRKMIDAGLFLEGHLDREETCLITSDETYQHYEQCRLQLEQRQKLEAQKPQNSHSPQVQEILDRGDAFVAQIRRCNDAIPGEEISDKISRMEMIVQRIFDRAETHPEIVPDLKKMMDHYLPMTVKLLNAYADMDAQPVQGENIQASKREIEETLDTLNLAYEKILDSIFADTALDVSSDISVLQTLLAQEGLTEDELSRMRKERNL